MALKPSQFCLSPCTCSRDFTSKIDKQQDEDGDESDDGAGKEDTEYGGETVAVHERRRATESTEQKKDAGEER